MIKNNILSPRTLRQFTNSNPYEGEFVILKGKELQELFKCETPAKIRFYALIFCKDDGGTIHIDHQPFEMKKRMVFFVNYHEFLNLDLEDNHSVSAIFFTKLFYNRIYTGNRKIKSDTALHGLPNVATSKTAEFKQLSDMLASILTEYPKNASLSREIICLQLKTLMLMYIRISGSENLTVARTDRKMTYVEEFKSLVDQHFKERKRTSDYATLLHISSNYLNAIIKDRLEISAERYIQNRVVLEAERLLLNTDLSVTEITYELGFTDKSHFGKYFKKNAGVSPNGFRGK